MSRRPLPLRRKLLYSLCAVLLVLGGAELFLRLAGFEHSVADPYESFVQKAPLFERDGDRFRTRASRTRFFHPQGFPADKPGDTCRIFVLGGSMVYGYALEEPRAQCWPSELRRLLEKSFPGRRFEVLNLGGICYASYRLVPILEECLKYSPDLLVVLTGNNEFLEPRQYAAFLEGRQAPYLGLKLFQGLLALGESLRPSEPEPGEELLLSSEYIGEKFVVREEAEFEHTLDHFRRNLECMAELSRAAGAPLVLATVPSNLRHRAPYWTGPGPGISQEELDREFERAMQLLGGGEHEQAIRCADAAFHFLRARQRPSGSARR